VDPLQFKYPHYTPFQYAGNKPISYIDLDGLEEAKINEAQVTHFFDNKSGKYLGQIDNFKPTGITDGYFGDTDPSFGDTDPPKMKFC
jgi:hypothetical protein